MDCRKWFYIQKFLKLTEGMDYDEVGKILGMSDDNVKRKMETIYHLLFLQSKKTGRWWMQMPDKRFIACSANDYMIAGSNEIPERWLRAQERS